MMDIEYQIKEFAEEYNGKLMILDMLKDIDFNIAYDINNYQLFSILCQRYLEVGTYKINLKDKNVSLIVRDTQIKNVKKVLNYLKKEYQNGVNISLLKIKIIYDMINQDENATLYNCKKKIY